MLFLTSLSDSETKAWLVASEILLIVATTVLVFGLIGEWSDSETWKNRIWYKVAKAAVIVGVIGELFGDAGIFETSARLDSIRELDNLKLQERAAKAELAIVKMKSPRKLTDVQQHDLIILLKRHTGKKFWIIVQRGDQDAGSEQMLFSAQISEVFASAGWHKDRHLSTDPSKEEPEFMHVSNTGCNIATAGDQRSLDLRKTIFDGLAAAEIDCFLNSVPDFLPEVIVIEIGLR